MTAPITLTDKIACVAREVRIRQGVYPKWVAAGRMKQEAADREIAVMTAVLADLEAMPQREEGRDAGR